MKPTHVRRRILPIALPVVLTLIAGWAGICAAQPAAETPAPEPDPMSREIETVRKMIANAQAKFHRGIAGFDDSRLPSDPTPAELCCIGNLEAIDTSMNEIRRLVREQGVCFEYKRNRDGVEGVTLVNQDLRSLSNAVELFRESTEGPQIAGALDGCTRAFLNLTRSLKALPVCATEAAATP